MAKKIKEAYKYPNSQSMCIVEIDYEHGQFSITDAVHGEFANVETIRDLYDHAGAFAIELINKEKSKI